jgi:hypothetical protein
MKTILLSTQQRSLIDCTAIISSCYEWSYIKITTTKEKHAAISFKIRYTMETYMKFTKHKRHRELNYDKSSLDRRGIFLIQIHLHEVNILQIHNGRLQFVKQYHGY